MWTTTPVDPTNITAFKPVFIQARMKSGHSQRSLAKLLSLGHSTLARFERNGHVGTHALRIMYLWVYPEASLPPCLCVICREAQSSFTSRQLRELHNLIDEKLQVVHTQCSCDIVRSSDQAAT